MEIPELKENFTFIRDESWPANRLGLVDIDLAAVPDDEVKAIVAAGQTVEQEARGGLNPNTVLFVYPEGKLSIDALKIVVKNWETWQYFAKRLVSSLRREN